VCNNKDKFDDFYSDRMNGVYIGSTVTRFGFELAHEYASEHAEA
jgi:hypothetical protein